MHMRVLAFLISMPLLSVGASNIVPNRIVALNYPRVAAQAGVEGMVVLYCLVAADGSVKAVENISGPPILAKAAVANVKLWRFAEQIGERVRVSYKFRIRGVNEEGRLDESSFVFESPNSVTVSVARPMLMTGAR